MSQLAFANAATSTLGAAITNVAVSITVAPGTGVLFPAIGSGQAFLATIFPATGSYPAPEIVLVTARATDVLTVVRARESTTAQAWGVGAIISQLNTAGTMGDLLQCVTYAGNPNGYVGGVAATTTTPPSLIWDSTNVKLWVCTTTGPAATAGWSPIYALLAGSSSQVFSVAPATALTHAVSWGELNGGTDTGTTDNIALTMSGITAYSQIAGIPITFQLANNITGASVVNINGIGNASLLQGGSGLSGGEGVAPWNYTIVYWAGSFHIIGSGAGAVNVGAPSSGAHATNVSWVSANFASLYGNSGNAFNVANATSAAQAVNLGQFLATLSSPGTQVLPNGMIIQWGATTAGAPSSVTFANTFPNACLSVVVSEANAGSGTWGLGKPTVHGATAQNQYGYTAWSETWNGSSWTGALNAQNYIAVGY